MEEADQPEDAQVLVIVREVRLWQFVDIMLGAAVLAVAVAQLGETIGPREALMFVLTLALGGAIIYQTLLLPGIVAVVLLAFSRWFWMFGLRHYSGASA